MRGGMPNMMKQIQKMQQDMAKLQEELGNKTVTEEAGGGMIKVTANGHREIVSVEIEPSVINPDEKEILEDLIVAAVNKAIISAKTMEETEMQKLTKGMLPPGMNIPGF